MARIRTIKPEMWQDERLASVSIPSRLLFVMLISTADDAGRFRAAGPLLRGALFPWDEASVKSDDVAAWLAELAGQGLVRVYEVGGVTYGDLPKWQKHQRIDNAARSLLPPHPDGPAEPPPVVERNGTRGDSPQSAANRGEPRRAAANRGEPPPSAARNTRPRTLDLGPRSGNTHSTADDNGTSPAVNGGRVCSPPGDGFAELWGRWPKRQRRAEAEAEWRKAVAAGVDVEALTVSATMWLRYWADEAVAERYVPRLGNWLARRGWADDPPEGNGDEARIARKRKVIEDFINEGNERGEP